MMTVDYDDNRTSTYCTGQKQSSLTHQCDGNMEKRDYNERPYQCCIELNLPSVRHAQQLQQILQVDREISYKDIHKSFDVVANINSANLNITFYATQARLLRVSVSSFYDYLVVALKCYQEFEG